MRWIFRIELPLVVLATMIVVGLVGAQSGAQNKRVIDMKAPVMNEKEIKVECVHTVPHMMLRNKVKETGVFSVTADARITWTDCVKDAQGRYVVEPGKRCMVKFHQEDIGKAVTQVSAETPSTRYIFRGEWPVYACCRGKFDSKLDQSKGPHSKEAFSDLWITDTNRALKTGTLYRGYAVTILPDRVDNHNREKDTINPFTLEGNFSSRQFARGPCDIDDK